MLIVDTISGEAQIARFSRICEAAMKERRTQGEQGVGTLAEKWQHQIVKRYLSENPDDHEKKVSDTRRFVSDVRMGQDAYEVQTGDFAPMAKKIAYYLESTDLTVTVVHPIPKDRWVSWVDPRSMEISPRRRSPRHGKASDILPRLYPLIPMLPNPRLKFRVLLLEVHDFRLLSGRKKNSRRGGERYERIPISLIEDIQLNSPKDFERFLPQALPSPFTVKDFSRATKIVGRDAYSSVRVLVALGLISPAPNTGRSMTFTVRSEN